jgi:hypothetical protein
LDDWSWKMIRASGMHAPDETTMIKVPIEQWLAGFPERELAIKALANHQSPVRRR